MSHEAKNSAYRLLFHFIKLYPMIKTKWQRRELCTEYRSDKSLYVSFEFVNNVCNIVKNVKIKSCAGEVTGLKKL